MVSNDVSICVLEGQDNCDFLGSVFMNEERYDTHSMPLTQTN